MIHDGSHVDRVVELHEKCETCSWLLRRAFNDVMPGLELGPSGADMLLARIEEIARGLYAKGAAS